MWLLIKKESLTNILTLRFVIGLLASSILFGVVTAVLVQDFRTKLEQAEAAIQDMERQIDEWTVFSYVRPVIVKKPTPLSIFGTSKGDRWGSRLLIAQSRYPAIAVDSTGEGESSDFLSLFAGLDFTAIVQVFISLLAILFTFDAISGEKESASLRQVLANPVNRTKLVISKFLGALVALVPIVLFSFVVSLIVFQIFTPLSFSASEWWSFGVIVLLVLLYGAFFAAFGLLISSLTHSSSTSLVVSMILWVILTLVVPNSIGLFSTDMGFDEDTKELDRNLEKVAEEHGGAVRELTGNIFQDYRAVFNIVSEGERCDGIFRARMLGPKASEYYLSKLPEIIRDQEEYALERYKLENSFLQRRFAKVEALRNLQRVSPPASLGHAVNAIVGSDANGYRHFLDEAGDYRRQLMAYMEGRGAFATSRWFTDDYGKTSVDDLLLHFETLKVEEQLQYLQEALPSLMSELRTLMREVENDPQRKLDLSDMPRFQSNAMPLHKALAAAAPDILLLFVFTALALVGAYIRFLYYDVR